LKIFARPRTLILASVMLVFLPSSRASAEWVKDGTPVCTEPGYQESPAAVSDGAGGAILTWRDQRDGTDYHVYAQRIDFSGTVRWQPDCVPLCTVGDASSLPIAASDGAGGAIVAWADDRNGNWDIFAQRVNSAGAIQWASNGAPVCTTSATQATPVIAPDGFGGAVIAWISTGTMFAQRIDATGTVLWASGGVQLGNNSPGYDRVSEPAIASDGAGGAIVCWVNEDDHYYLYANRVNASGTVLWTADGIYVSDSGVTHAPRIISNGPGGSIIAWEDLRSDWNIHAQRLDSTGAAQWTAGGVRMTVAAAHQYKPDLITDGSGGALVVWTDSRGAEPDIYAQRVDSTGAIQWLADGVALCAASGGQMNPDICSDGSTGALIAWFGNQTGDEDVYAQRVDSSGSIQWEAEGVSLSAETGNQANYRFRGGHIVPDGTGGAIVAWQDARDADEDVYAQRVTASGIPGSDIVPVSLPAVLITAATMGLLGIRKLRDLKLRRIPF